MLRLVLSLPGDSMDMREPLELVNSVHNLQAELVETHLQIIHLETDLRSITVYKEPHLPLSDHEEMTSLEENL